MGGGGAAGVIPYRHDLSAMQEQRVNESYKAITSQSLRGRGRECRELENRRQAISFLLGYVFDGALEELVGADQVVYTGVAQRHTSTRARFYADSRRLDDLLHVAVVSVYRQ